MLRHGLQSADHDAPRPSFSVSCPLRRGLLALSCRAWLLGQALRMQRHFKLGLMDPVFRETIVRKPSPTAALKPVAMQPACTSVYLFAAM